MSTPSTRFAAASAQFTALLTAVPADGWGAPSACEGWSVQEVVQHVVTTEADFLAQRVQPVDGLSIAADASPMDAWPAVRAAMQAALDDAAVASTAFDGYFGPTTVEAVIDRFYTMDLIVHRWDIASVLGLSDHATLTADEVASVRSALVGLEAAMRSPGLFGPELPAAEDADEQTRLLAYIGRAAG
ncbi:MAG: TIGR03086 family metal-binding protein [Ilumatobacteraceae bacterium]